MIKVFISQPMAGLTDEEILVERQRIINEIEVYFTSHGIGRGGFEIIDSFFEDYAPDATPLEFLARSLMLLARADYIFMGKGWENTRGCKIEHQAAVAYGIKCLYDN